MHIKKIILYHKSHHKYIVQKFHGMVAFKGKFFLKSPNTQVLFAMYVAGA